MASLGTNYPKGDANEIVARNLIAQPAFDAAVPPNGFAWWQGGEAAEANKVTIRSDPLTNGGPGVTCDEDPALGRHVLGFAVDISTRFTDDFPVGTGTPVQVWIHYKGTPGTLQLRWTGTNTEKFQHQLPAHPAWAWEEITCPMPVASGGSTNNLKIVLTIHTNNNGDPVYLANIRADYRSGYVHGYIDGETTVAGAPTYTFKWMGVPFNSETQASRPYVAPTLLAANYLKDSTFRTAGTAVSNSFWTTGTVTANTAPGDGVTHVLSAFSATSTPGFKTISPNGTLVDVYLRYMNTSTGTTTANGCTINVEYPNEGNTSRRQFIPATAGATDWQTRKFTFTMPTNPKDEDAAFITDFTPHVHIRHVGGGYLSIAQVRLDLASHSAFTPQLFDGDNYDTDTVDYRWEGSRRASNSAAYVKTVLTVDPPPPNPTLTPSSPLKPIIYSTPLTPLPPHPVVEPPIVTPGPSYSGDCQRGDPCIGSVKVRDDYAAVEGRSVADLVGQGDSDSVVATATQCVALVQALASAYTYGRGFDDDGAPNGEIGAVITLASARLLANPEQLSVGVGSVSIRNGFTAWSLAELAVLNRYRRRSQ